MDTKWGNKLENQGAGE